MALNAGTWLEMNARLYGRFAASLHGEARFHCGYDLIIRQSEARNVGPIQEINMDGRALGLVQGATLSKWRLSKFGFGQ